MEIRLRPPPFVHTLRLQSQNITNKREAGLSKPVSRFLFSIIYSQITFFSTLTLPSE